MDSSGLSNRGLKIGFCLDNLEEPVTPPVTELNVVEPNVALVVAAVVLVICL